DTLRSGDREKKLVFLTARVHPGESPASFVCQGVIDFLVSQHPVAQVLRDHVIFKIVPMLNPDGVYLGNYRYERSLNKGLQVSRWLAPWVSLEFYIDVHAHSTMLNGFMYGNVFEDEERVQRQAVFPRLLCQNAPDFSFSNTSFNRDVVKAGTGRRFLGGLLDDTSYCYTLEVSFYSYMTAGSTATVPYTEETCILHRVEKDPLRGIKEEERFVESDKDPTYEKYVLPPPCTRSGGAGGYRRSPSAL
uniref:ATP/GTP binding protein like 4 n=1 Tax=Stegastes partitus TaxID=144197 RepID=A0A3B4ZUN1_9TELE